CTARPELLEERPAWAAGENTTLIRLDPLSEEESAAMIELTCGRALPRDALARIAEAAEGNPLYIEQLVALLSENGDRPSELTIPATLQALLAARLDRLGPAELGLLERAAVVGRVFERGALTALVPPELRQTLDAHLAGLVRRQLIQPWSGRLPDDEGYRFRHILIRDAA